MRIRNPRSGRRAGRAVLLLAAALAAALTILVPMVAFAHAELASASPGPNDELLTAPNVIELRFTEPVAPAFSEITVLDRSGTRIDQGGSQVDSNDHTIMTLPLPPLANGTYTVTWRNVSEVDGHARQGWYVFAVGEPIDPEAGLEDDTSILTSPFDPPVRTLALLGGLVLVGGIVFDRAIAGPALGRVRDHGPGRRLRDARDRWTQRLLLGGLALWAVGTLLQLLVQIAVATGGPIYQPSMSAARSLLTETTWGQAWLARLALILVAAVLLQFWLRRREGNVPLVLIVLAALLAHSWASHSGALSALRPAGISTDFVHLVAASIWVGGLIGLVALIREARAALPADEARRFLGVLLPRFSLAAGLSVGALVLSGVFLAWMHVHELGAFDTAYGRTLLLKLALFAVMLAIGATNLFWTTREAERSDRGGLLIARLVTAESVLAVLVIVAVGAMTSMEPARSVADAREGARTVRASVDDVDARLRLEPGGLGTNRLEVELESRGEAVRASGARLRITYLESDIGDVNVELERIEDGRFAADGVLFGVAGAWRAEITASRLDGFDVRIPFLFQVGTPEAAGTPLPVGTARALWVAMWIGLAALFHAVALRLRGRHATGTSALQWSGSAFVVFAVLTVTSTGPFALGGSAALGNPLPPSAEVLARGEEIFGEHCATCHGQRGVGDGPTAVEGGFAGVRLDLTLHVPLHTDAQLRQFVENGIPNTPMPAWGGTLSSDDMWSVIHYIRDLAQRAEN